MEIIISDVDLKDNEQADQVDRLNRSIFKKFKDAIWERTGNGYMITI